MEAPVWAFMQRVDLTGGSTGYHRYQLVDAFVNHFSEWWLLGETDPMSWGVWVMRDVTNVYVSTGLTGGLLTLIVLLLVLIFAFGNVGRALKMSSIARSPKRQWICWCIGVAICVHAFTFLGASYFGQMMVMLYLELALASCVYVFARRDARKQRAKTRVLEAQRPRNEIVSERPIPSQSGPGRTPVR
jgi:nicotinamide riboside transporter PnuC